MRARFAFVAFMLCTGCEAKLDVLGPAPGELSGEAGAPIRRGADIVAAYEDTCAVVGSGLFCWGTAPDGHVTATPEHIAGGGAATWQRMTSGQRAHCGSQANGSVWCFGVNDQGQLAQGDLTTRLDPAPAPLPSPAASVRGHFVTFCARLLDGSLECWGDNEEGEMGLNEPTAPFTDALFPMRIGTANDYLDVDVGQGHVCAVRAPGALWCWGRNTTGELGLGAGAAVQIRTPTRVGDGNDWTSVATGQGHTCALRAGSLYCFGDGSGGQLGTGDRNERDVPTQIGDASDWTSIDVDTFHSCGIRTPGTLHCWGRNAEGQLGVGDAQDRDTPTQVGQGSDWVQVSVGRFHTCGRRADGSLWCTGENADGRLGTGNFDRMNVMTRVVLGAAGTSR